MMRSGRGFHTCRVLAGIITSIFLVPCASNGQTEWLRRNPLPTGETLSQVAFGNGRFVAVGGTGTIVASSDGEQWTARDALGWHFLSSVCFSHQGFLAVGETILRSSDGLAWEQSATRITNALFSVTSGAGQIVAVGQNAAIYLSHDGMIWEDCSVQENGTFHSVAFGNGHFVAVGTTDSLSPLIYTSDDGRTWNKTPWNFGPFFTVSFVEGRFWASGYSSLDGIDWNVPSASEPFGQHSGENTGLAFGHDLYVAVFDRSGVGPRILTSPDMQRWTVASTNSAVSLRSVVFGNGRFVAVGGAGAILSSEDGLNWRLHPPAVSQSNLRSVTFGADTFVAVGWFGTVLASPNGRDWTAQTLEPLAFLEGVAFGNSTFVIAGREYQGGAKVYVSPDGQSWGEVRVSAAGLGGIAYGNGVFVAVGGFLVLTSTNGLDWTQHNPGTPPLDRIYHDGDRFIAYYSSAAPVFASEDGIDWRRLLADEPVSPKSASGQRAVVRSDLTWSTDGRVWQQAAWPWGSGDVAFGKGSFVAVGGGGLVLQSAEAPFLAVDRGTEPSFNVTASSEFTLVRLQSSANLLEWETVSDLTLTNGAATSAFPGYGRSPQVFLRVIVPSRDPSP